MESTIDNVSRIVAAELNRAGDLAEHMKFSLKDVKSLEHANILYTMYSKMYQVTLAATAELAKKIADDDARARRQTEKSEA